MLHQPNKDNTITLPEGSKVKTLAEADHPRITLCPALEYKSYCQICGSCEYCPHYKAKEGDNCEGIMSNIR